MSDELHKYPGNLKHHKVEAPIREITSVVLPMPEDASPYKQAEVSILREGFVRGYEAARAKDAELIQRLVDALHDSQPNHHEDAHLRYNTAMDAAEAAGFKPSEQ